MVLLLCFVFVILAVPVLTKWFRGNNVVKVVVKVVKLISLGESCFESLVDD